MIKVILFDFYGLFLPDAYDAWLQGNGLKREGVFASLIERSNRGEMTEAEFLSDLSGAIGREVEPGEIHAGNPEPNTELIDLARSLKPRYKVCLFSNASPKLRGRLKQLGIDDLFEEVIISSEIGHAKPSDKAFAIAINRTGVKSEEIFFVDDNPKNIEAALKNGLQASLYTSVAELRHILATLPA